MFLEGVRDFPGLTAKRPGRKNLAAHKDSIYVEGDLGVRVGVALDSAYLGRIRGFPGQAEKQLARDNPRCIPSLDIRRRCLGVLGLVGLKPV